MSFSLKQSSKEAKQFGIQAMQAITRQPTHIQPQIQQIQPTQSIQPIQPLPTLQPTVNPQVTAQQTTTHGKMGPLGNDVIFEISLTSTGIQLIQQLRGILSMASLVREFRKHVYEVLQDYVDLKIDTWVPMDSGDLRDSMHNSITPSQTGTSFGQGFPFKMILGTPGIQYAKVVNKMITPWLVHPAPYHRNVGRYGDLLNDPDAKHGWYSLVLLNGRNKAYDLIQQYFNDVSTVLNKVFHSNAYNYARQMFTVRYL